MDKRDSREFEPKREGSKKRAAVSTSGERLSKVAWMWASSDLRRLEGIIVPCCRSDDVEVVKVMCLVRARDEKENVVVSLVWEAWPGWRTSR